jgi:hypothetical protein
MAAVIARCIRDCLRQRVVRGLSLSVERGHGQRQRQRPRPECWAMMQCVAESTGIAQHTTHHQESGMGTKTPHNTPSASTTPPAHALPRPTCPETRANNPCAPREPPQSSKSPHCSSRRQRRKTRRRHARALQQPRHATSSVLHRARAPACNLDAPLCRPHND